jgi:hypothetical protein
MEKTKSLLTELVEMQRNMNSLCDEVIRVAAIRMDAREQLVTLTERVIAKHESASVVAADGIGSSKMVDALREISVSMNRIEDFTSKRCRMEMLRMHFECISRIHTFDGAIWHCWSTEHTDGKPVMKALELSSSTVKCSCGAERPSYMTFWQELAEESRRALDDLKSFKVES